MTILLIGKTGKVGHELTRFLPSLGDVVAVDRTRLDLLAPDSIIACVREIRPEVIVNAAAYTDVNRAEAEEELVRRINADGPAILAEEARRLGATLIHYSTDYVFDGSRRTPWVETDATNPLNAYGRTKLAGERAIADSGAAHLILRTSWIYATRGASFLLKIVAAATQKETLEVVNDQFGSPTWSRIIAAATEKILRAAGDPSRLKDLTGVYHLTASGETSWFEFARAILSNCRPGAPLGSWFRETTGGRPIVARVVRPISSDSYPSPAPRPAYSVLSNQKVADKFGLNLPDWRLQLDWAIADRAAEDWDRS